MIELLAMYYNWFKAFHIIAVICWMAGLLYLPRLFVYHVEAGDNVSMTTTFGIMERRLLRIIMNPAMIAAWIFGLIMFLINPGLLENGWMHLKITGFVLMTVLHMAFARWRKALVEGTNTHPARFYRLWNEAPALLMVIIVIMAVAEPF